MPKITAVDAKTGQPQGEVIMGRHMKIQTQATPNPEDSQPPKATQEASQGQPNKSEGSKTEATPLDPKFEALARKEAAFRQREREFQAREATYKEKEAKLAQAETFQSRLKENPLDVLNELGITYDQLVEQAVNAPDSATKEIQNELKRIRQTQDKLAQDAQDSSKAQRQAALKQIRYDVTDLIDQDPQFETIKATNSADEVVELIERTFDQEGKLLTVDQAAKMVEDELFEEAKRIASIGKVKATLKPELTPELISQTKQQTSKQQPMTTLTNNMTSNRPLTARERAIKRFKGEAF